MKWRAKVMSSLKQPMIGAIFISTRAAKSMAKLNSRENGANEGHLRTRGHQRGLRKKLE